MESGSGGRVRRQLQAVGRVAAYLGGGFLLLSTASTAAVRSLRYLSDTNQRKFATPCGSCEGKGTYPCRLCRGSSTVEWSPLYDPVFVNPCLCPTCDGLYKQDEKMAIVAGAEQVMYKVKTLSKHEDGGPSEELGASMLRIAEA